MEEIITKSIQQTQHVAEELAGSIQPGEIITLSGTLGAGKTTFAQGLAKGLGIVRRIISPTFVIIRTYELKSKTKNVKTFYHIDLYRLEDEKSLTGLGLEEILQEKDAVTLIEWPEKMGRLLPQKRWDIKIEALGENDRKITVKKFSI